MIRDTMFYMIQDFLNKYVAQAKYELIDEGTQFYAEIKALRGVWATGKTIEECRENLLSAMESWLIVSLRHGVPVPGFKAPKALKLKKQYA